jgi:hypothetical protein
MAKFERIINIPAVLITRRAAEEIVELTHLLAERRITADLSARLRVLYSKSPNSLNIFSQASIGKTWQTEEEFVAQNIENEAYRDLLRPAYGDRYTFISPNGNVQFVYNDFTYDDMPPDNEVILIEAAGPSGEVLGLNAKARPQFLELKDPNWNRILVQGPDRAWVNDTYSRLKAIIESSKEPFRHVAYHYMPLFVWATFFAIVILEYKLFRLLSGFDWSTPLNGLQLLFAFIVLALTLMGSSHLFQRILHFVYPYFELEGNLSRRRIVWRKPVMAAIGALYAAAVVMLFAVK